MPVAAILTRGCVCAIAYPLRIGRAKVAMLRSHRRCSQRTCAREIADQRCLPIMIAVKETWHTPTRVHMDL